MLYHPNARRHDCPKGKICTACAYGDLCDSLTFLADSSRRLGFALRRSFAGGDRYRSWRWQRDSWRWNSSYRARRTNPENVLGFKERA